MREFKVGDAVFCPLFGEGVVETEGGIGEEYPLRVKFASVGVKRYTCKGGYTTDANPTLLHVETATPQFRVGDAVVCDIFGEGFVDRAARFGDYPVYVTFTGGARHLYTADGRLTPNSPVTLRHAKHEALEQSAAREELINALEDSAASLAKQIVQYLIRY